MSDSSTALSPVLQFRQDLQTKLRDSVRRAIETVLEEELLAALGAAAHEPYIGAARVSSRHDRADGDHSRRDAGHYGAAGSPARPGWAADRVSEHRLAALCATDPRGG